MRTVGVDIGGTKIAAGLVDEHGTVTRSARRPTPATTAADVLDVAAELVAEVCPDGPPDAIGVGARGVIDPVAGVVLAATDILPGWSGMRLRAELADRTGTPAIAVDNDVRAMAHGEAMAGAGRGHRLVLSVAVGTGVGGAITRNGHLWHGEHGTAGEIAHLLVPRRGARPCGCGRFDHLEAVASGPAIAAEYAARTGRPLPLPEAVSRIEDGDTEAAAVVTEAATLLGRTLAGLVTALDVDAVVLGGGVVEIGARFHDPAGTALAAEVRPSGRSMPVLVAALGSRAALVGAALLGRRRLTGAVG